MAETLSSILKKLHKQLEVLETPETKKAQESIDQSLKAMKNIGQRKYKGGLISRKDGGGIGVTKKDVQTVSRKRKRTPTMGVTPKDVKQARKQIARKSLTAYKQTRRAMGKKPTPPIRHEKLMYGYKAGGKV